MTWYFSADLSNIIINGWDWTTDLIHGCPTCGSTKASLTAGLIGCAVQGQGHDSG